MKKIVAIVVALALCLSMTAAMAEDTIKLGSIGPLTGPYAQYGMAVANAAQLAIEEENAKGGVQFSLLSEDDQGDGELAVSAYNTEMDQGLKILIGTVTSGACAAVADVAYTDRVFLLTPSASAPVVNEGKDNVYQVCFIDPNQGMGAADYIKNYGIGTKVGIIYNSAIDYSTGIQQSFVDEAGKIGLEVAAQSAFTDDANADFSVQLSAMKDAGCDVVFLPIYYTPIAAIMTQAKKMDYSPVFFGVDGLDGLLSVEGFDTSLAEGAYMLTPFDADAQDEATVKFVTDYKARFGEVPNQFAADAYDAVHIVAEACRTLEITADTPYDEACEKLIPYMQTITYTGLTGSDMTWDAEGRVNKLAKAVVIHDGKYTSVDK